MYIRPKNIQNPNPPLLLFDALIVFFMRSLLPLLFSGYLFDLYRAIGRAHQKRRVTRPDRLTCVPDFGGPVRPQAVCNGQADEQPTE